MAQTLAPTFGDLLKQLRKRAGMTQGDLAAAVGYSVSFVSVLEQNRRLPDVDAVLHVFVPALGLQDELHLATRLVELAASARGERPPIAITRQRETQIVVTEAHSERSTHLPVAPTDLIGRAQEVRQLCQRLPGHSGRLLTLVGPPGIGKTQLALAVAAHLHYHYPDGAAFVMLAAVSDAVLMAATIAASVGCSDASPKPPKTKLIECLRRKIMLLVLDNLEQIRDGAPLIADLLAECPGLCVLATSRERLHLRAEQRFQVPPLDLAPAIELFVQRAQAVNADFRLTPQNQPTLAAICQRLDRLPLALELCAAQIDLLAPAQLLAQLQDRRLDLLVDGAHDLPPRQRTLRTAIQHSYGLLDEEERTLLRRLGIFVGGFDLPTVAAVAADSMATAARPLNATLHALIGKSLVRAETMPSGEQRFVMLETIREYALERLEASGEAERLRQQHAAFFVTLSEAGVRHDCLEMEYPNLRAALEWSRTEADGTTELRLVVALDGFWRHSGYLSEGRLWLTDALTPRADGAAWPDTTAARSLRAKALARLGDQAAWQNDQAAAQPVLEESLALFRELGDTWNIADTLGSLGVVGLFRGDYERSRALLEESLTLFRQLEDRGGIAMCFFFMGHLAYAQGNLRRASERYQEGLSMFRQLEHTWMTASFLLHLGIVALDEGDAGRAGAYLTESLTRLRDLGDRWMAVHALEVCAGVAAARGAGRAATEDTGRRAVRLFGAVEAERETLGAPTLPIYQAHYQRGVAAARTLLDDATFAAAWAEGRALTLKQAITEALEESPINDGSRLDAKESSL